MNLTERDIFNYVICPQNLSVWKIKQIKMYKKYLIEHLMLCNSLQSVMINFNRQKVLDEKTFSSVVEQFKIENDLQQDNDFEYPTENIVKLAEDGQEEKN